MNLVDMQKNSIFEKYDLINIDDNNVKTNFSMLKKSREKEKL